MARKVCLLMSAAFFVALLAGCSSSVESTPAGKDVTKAGEVEVIEKEMKAVVGDGNLDFKIMLHNKSGRLVSGEIFLQLLRISDDGTGEEAAGSGSRRFEQSPGQQEYTITMSAPGLSAGKSNLAAYVMTYRIKVTGGTILGYKSLFDAIEKVEAVFMSPDEFISGEKARMRLLARDPATGRPMKAVPYRVMLVKGEGDAAEKREVASGSTDENGTAEIEGDVEEGDEGEGDIQVFIGEGDSAQIVEGRITVTRSRKILLTTDKPIYQPGQLIHIRTLALRRPNLLPDADRPVLVEVLDAKGNKVFKKSLRTSEFGVAYASFRLATEVIMGRYTIRAAMDDTVTEKAVTVDRYVLPKFKVSFATEKAFYLPGETVRGSVDALYFFGKPVAGGTVEISAKTFDVELAEFATVTGTTDENGHWNFEIELPDYFAGLPLDQGDAYLQFDVVVTDLAEHKEKLSKTAVVAAQPIEITVIPEAGEMVAGATNLFYVVTTDPTGAPVATDCSVSAAGSSLDIETDGNGIGAFELAPSDGEASITIAARDEAGHTASTDFSFSAASQSYDGFVLVRTDRSLYKVGDTVAIQVLTDGSQDRVYLDVIQNLRTVLTRTLPVENGKAVWGLDLDGGKSGTLEIYAYILAPSSNIVRCRKIVWVDPANELTVRATADKEVYRPAEQAAIEFNVTDAQGIGRAAAIGVQVVDEAVFALTEFRPGLEKTFFNIENEVMKPRYQIKGYSTDVVTDDSRPAEEREKMAGVLFSAASGGGAYPIEVNTYRRALEAGMAVVKSYVEQDIVDILMGLGRLAEDGVLTRENYRSVIDRMKGNWFDPFGQRYEVYFKDYPRTPGDEQWYDEYYEDYYKDYYMVFRSAGMDEVMNTADDVEVQHYKYEAIYGYYRNGGMWEDEDAAGPPPGPPTSGGDPNNGGGKHGSGQAPYVRRFFPETLYVNPAIITDETGKAELALPMADSITTWRMSMLASSLDGKLGSAEAGIRVFQPFFIDIDFPATLTRNDEISAPVAVYNYLETAQSVRLEVEAQPWFRLDDSSVKTVDLEAGEVSVVYFRIKALNVGFQPFRVYGYGSEMSDAIERRVHVVPDGKEQVVNFSDRLGETVRKTITIPEEAIDGASKIFVKIYPGLFSQAVEGLDSLLQVPYG